MTDVSRLEVKVERLEKLLAVTKAMATQHDLDSLLDFITHEAANIVGAERASIFIVTDDRSALTSRIALGVDEKTILAFPIKAGIAGFVARTGEIVTSEDPYNDERFNARIDAETGFKTFNLVCVPMYGSDSEQKEPMGVFEVLNKKDGSISEDDIEMLLAFSGQAAVAIENARLLGELKHARDRLDRENTRLRQRFLKKYAFENIIGSSPVMSEVLSLSVRVAESTANILITGESGTGKDLLARAIHGRSPRAGGTFVALNCAALPESLLEAELFGIEKGVATGVEERDGKIALAGGGTLFLDEIGDMSIATQAKVLRVLQEREFTRVGGSETIHVDIRVIAATNKDLKVEIEAGNFREDLFYRLNVVEVRLPSLHERREDILLLAEHFLEIHAEES
ncbi:MAG: sigma 54-interacting transcriptional regulator, partial [Planctomycetota bacterium]